MQSLDLLDDRSWVPNYARVGLKSLKEYLVSHRYQSEEARKHAEALERWTKSQAQAETYEQWLFASEQLDKLSGNDKWKEDPVSPYYDSVLVQQRLQQLRDARVNSNMDELLYLVRTSLQRNLGNMGDPRLYVRTHTGSKTLIEQYIAEVELALDTLLSCGPGTFSPKVLLSNLIQTRKAFGRTALVLSGGSTFGILHIGVMRELHRAHLLPQVISGSSAGSIFASMLCIHLEDEIEELLQLPLHKESFEIFEPAGEREGLMVRLARFLKHGTWFDNKYLSTTMRELLGDLTFQEAYYRTQRILNVTVSPSSMHEMPKILNYLTAPNVLIWSAVCASCSVPFVFDSHDILAKNPRSGEFYSWNASTFIDGSVYNDLPLSRLAEMFNVNHFIACQVNPHVVPFVKFAETMSLVEARPTTTEPGSLTKLWHSTQLALSSEISHYLDLAAEMGLFKNISSKLRSVLDQQYSGDITILPELYLSEFGQIFKNPSKEFFQKAELRAARATWPKMSHIHNRVAIELALVKAIHKLRARIVSQSVHDPGSSLQVHAANDEGTLAPIRRRHSSTKLHHRRQRSDGMAVKYLVRRHSLQYFGTEGPGPTALSRKKSSAGLTQAHTPTPSLTNSVSVGGSPRHRRFTTSSRQSSGDHLEMFSQNHPLERISTG